MWLGLLLKAVLNWVFGTFGLQAAQRARESQAEKHGEAVGAAKAVTEELEKQIAETYQDTHAPTVEEMNDLFASRGKRP